MLDKSAYGWDQFIHLANGPSFLASRSALRAKTKEELNPVTCPENVNEATWMTIDMEERGTAYTTLHTLAGNGQPCGLFITLDGCFNLL